MKKMIIYLNNKIKKKLDKINSDEFHSKNPLKRAQAQRSTTYGSADIPI